LLVANVVLRTRLLRDAVSGSSLDFAIRGNSTELLLDYESAYSLFPGRIHVEGLKIRGRERTLEWLLTLDHADVVFSLRDLLRRRVHATSASASGLAIRLRLRLERSEATPDVVAALPPIAGFVDPPLLDGGPAPPLLTDENYDLWTVELEDLDVEHVREVWIQTWRSKGDTHVRGRLHFRPQRGLEVGPATVDAYGVDLFYGRRLLVAGLHGSVLATLHPFDLRKAKGLAIVDQVSYDGRLRGRALIAEILRLFAPESGVDFKRCEGPLDARIVLSRGKLVSGTRILTEAADCEVGTADLTFRAPIRTTLAVDAGLGTIETRVSDLRVSRSGVEQARVSSLVAAVKSRQLELARAFGDTVFSLDVADAEANDLGEWMRFLPSASSLAIRSGKVTANIHANGSLVEGSEWAAGSADVTAADVAVHVGRAALAGSVAAHVELRRGTLSTRTFDVSGSSFVLRNGSARAAGKSGSAVVVLPSLSANTGRFVLSPSGEEGHVSLDLPQVDVIDLSGLGALLPLPAGLRIDGGNGRGRFRADVELPSWSTQGDAELALRGVRARVGVTKLFGELTCSLKAQHLKDADGTTGFSGIQLAVTRAGTGTALSSDGAWWGKLELHDATLRRSGGLRFDAKAHLTAKDATPGTLLVSQNTAVPSWAADVVQMPVLRADARLTVLSRTFDLRSIVAHGEDSSLRAEYAEQNGQKDGGVLIDLGWLRFGYDLADGAPGLVLTGSEGWFERKRAAMSARASAASDPD
jgi:hypothetical protein